METGLKGKSVIVAASSQGLGRATAAAFAAEGARVAMCSRDKKSIDAAAAEIRSKHKGEVLAEALDVTDNAAVQQFVEHVVKQFGTVHVCVTNAGGPPAKNFLSVTPEEWQRGVQLNFLSAVWFARAVIPYMQKNRWGRIVTITSVSVKQPIGELVISNAVRAAVVGLVKSLANEFGKDGILVNNVGPGYTATDRLKELAATRALASGGKPEEIYGKWSADVPIGRLGRPEELADTIVFLASERASYITGQTILVDGGYYKGVM